MASLESYNFRQYRGTTPKAKAVVKREDSARIASPQKRPPADVSSRVDEDTALLKAFDLDYTYGPAIGMTRLQRWNRAQRLGLGPPPRVKEALERHVGEPTYAECLWAGTLETA